MSDFEPRRAKPGQTFTVTGPDGEQTEITADDDGIVRPKSAGEQAALAAFGLPVSRKAQAADAAAAEADNEPVKVVKGGAAAAEKGGSD